MNMIGSNGGDELSTIMYSTQGANETANASLFSKTSILKMSEIMDEEPSQTTKDSEQPSNTGDIFALEDLDLPEGLKD